MKVQLGKYEGLHSSPVGGTRGGYAGVSQQLSHSSPLEEFVRQIEWIHVIKLVWNEERRKWVDKVLPLRASSCTRLCTSLRAASYFPQNSDEGVRKPQSFPQLMAYLEATRDRISFVASSSSLQRLQPISPAALLILAPYIKLDWLKSVKVAFRFEIDFRCLPPDFSLRLWSLLQPHLSNLFLQEDITVRHHHHVLKNPVVFIISNFTVIEILTQLEVVITHPPIDLSHGLDQFDRDVSSVRDVTIMATPSV
ncbi:hypothetical protein J6590_038319 [Homalodisca vitripennis]|nr:hypothetical protein J6590_038319 [Homalodisca vitripennis]